jgi:hypothetical protein
VGAAVLADLGQSIVDVRAVDLAAALGVAVQENRWLRRTANRSPSAPHSKLSLNE